MKQGPGFSRGTIARTRLPDSGKLPGAMRILMAVMRKSGRRDGCDAEDPLGC